jgi:hypothetical protein
MTKAEKAIQDEMMAISTRRTLTAIFMMQKLTNSRRASGNGTWSVEPAVLFWAAGYENHGLPAQAGY